MTFKEYVKQIQATENFLDVLNFYSIHYKKENNYYKASCPLHDEKTPSFFVYQEGDKAKFKCQGCGKNGDIIDFIQYKEGINNKQDALKRVYEILGLKLDLKPSKLDKLKEYIYNNMQMEGYKIESIYIYTLEDHTPSFLKVKYRSLTDKSKKDMRTYKIIDTGEFYKLSTKKKSGEYIYTIYNYPKVKQAIGKQQYIYIVEGEKDAETLNKLGLTATTFYSKKWQEAYTKQLQDAKVVFIGDTGEAGEQFKKFVWKNLKDIVRTFRIVTLPGLEQLGDNKDVTDWIETGHTKDELIEAIKEAKDIKWYIHWKQFSLSQKDKKIIPIKCIENFEQILKRSNTQVFYNEITKNIEVKTTTFKNYTLDTLIVEIQSLCSIIGYKCLKTEVRDWLITVAYKNSINPFRNYLDNLKDKWDNKSRLEEYYNCFETVEFFNEDLKKILIKCWLLQFVDSAYNPKFTSQGLLVLKGKQGIGKTTAMSKLIPIEEDWVFLPEQSFRNDRDSIQKVISNQLVEFSEFARSNKAVDELKAFITTPIDRLSLKYDKFTTDFRRKTIYYATVNDAQFLIDEENRRFWIIDLASINREKLNKFNYNQLWAELYYIYHVMGDKKCFLNDEETQMLEESNQQFKVQDELTTDILNTFDFNSDKRIYLTSAEVVQFLPKREGATKVARRLNGLHIKNNRMKDSTKNMERNTYFEMPFPKFWLGKVDKKFKDRIVGITVVPEKNSNNDNDLIIELRKQLDFYRNKCAELMKENQELKEINEWYERKIQKVDF